MSPGGPPAGPPGTPVDPPGTPVDRRAYLEGGLTGLVCDSCGVRVRVKKSSAEQTSVQWSASAVRGCAEFADRNGRGEPTALIATCGKLRDTIERAAREGWLRPDAGPDGGGLGDAPGGGHGGRHGGGGRHSGGGHGDGRDGERGREPA